MSDPPQNRNLIALASGSLWCVSIWCCSLDCPASDSLYCVFIWIWFIWLLLHLVHYDVFPYNMVHLIALASGLLSCVLFLCTPFSFFFHMVSCLHWQQRILVLLFFEGILDSWDSCSVLWSYRRVTFSTCVSKASIDQELLRVLWRRWPAWWKQQCRGKFRL